MSVVEIIDKLEEAMALAQQKIEYLEREIVKLHRRPKSCMRCDVTVSKHYVHSEWN
jgi:prefoldin subunit 5